MNILIDFTQIPINKVGVGVYGYNLIKNIDKLNDSNIYFVLIQNDEKCFSYLGNKKITFIKVKSSIFRIFFFRIILEQFYIPYIVRKYEINLVHSLHYSFPVFCFNAKKIVTIHDLTFFIFPKLHRFIKRYYFRLFTNLAASHCDRIICVSQSTKEDLIKYTNIKPNIIDVIYLGRNETRIAISDKDRIGNRGKFNINKEKKIILFIGTIEPRKNIIAILKAFCVFKKDFTNYQLVIAGRKGWYCDNVYSYIEEMNLEDVVLTGYIEEKEKNILLSDANMFIYPSVYEGFGIPVLEAIDNNVPTITSNVSSLPEVGGNAVLLITPDSISEIITAFKELSSNNKLRDDLIHKCSIQAAKFSWKNMTIQTVNTYNYFDND